MKMRSKLLVAGITVAALMVFGLTGTALAAGPSTQTDGAVTVNTEAGQPSEQGACWGDPGAGAGPGLMHHYGQPVEQGACWGEPGDGASPGLMNHYGQTDQEGNSWGEPSDGAGPGLMNQWGKSAH